MYKIATLILAVSLTLTGCEWTRDKVHAWTAPPQPGTVVQGGTIGQPTVKDPSVPSVPSPVTRGPLPEPPVACVSEPAMVLCKVYQNKAALLADPKVQAFAFTIYLDEVVIKTGLLPGLKYRTLPNGNVSRV